ncbi:MAG: CoA transferase subunit A [Desulfobacterales bacterium]
MATPWKTDDKICTSAEAVAEIRSGDRIMVGSFGNSGYPEELVDAVAESDLKELTIISNDLGSPGIGLGKFLANRQVKALIGNYYNWNPDVAAARNAGVIEVTLIPQGTFAEAIRAAGVGIPAFFVATGAGTELARGKKTEVFDGRTYIMEQAIHADVALVRALKADTLGNLVYYKTARNFNPLMAMAAKLTIVEVDEVVPAGDLDPECVITPHIFVDKIVKKVKS